MVRRGGFHSFWRDFDEMMNEMRAEMEGRFQSLLTETGTGHYLPAIRGEGLRVDVCSHEDEIVVAADLPGADRENVSLRLVTPRLLEIAAIQKQEKEGEEEGYFMRERVYGSMKRTVSLPAEVTEEGASATFKNGVLEVHLKKVEVERGTLIPIE
ncbi:Hsp20/alpha crystallin family protein [Methanofollis fontis]|uniref:Hsp20/alpha crystallin family protein n=1 Tax=Methanofollis fontis TaxID=2052832 RepID=A0A483CU59_9EURY|nr:Hsp20/alpha crystallin family protein [Methanofollis fontis]TAJ44834.1 Hsp20/alpha crystallin family protein [Methanofollis fontis]